MLISFLLVKIKRKTSLGAPTDKNGLIRGSYKAYFIIPDVLVLLGNLVLVKH